MERKIMEVLRRMQTVISEEQLQELKNTLRIVFTGCELVETTAIQVVDGELDGRSGRLSDVKGIGGKVARDNKAI